MEISRRKTGPQKTKSELTFYLKGLTSEEYDTIYWSLKEYADDLVKFLADPEIPTGAEDEAFCGPIIGMCGDLMVEMENHNRERGDVRW